jgi:PAS domain S-box-containing protein
MTEPSPLWDPALDGEAARLIIAHARDYAIMTLDLDGRILSWSPGAERITGRNASEAIGLDFRMLFTPSDIAAGEDRIELQKAWRDGRAEDSRWHVRRDGSRFWANGVTMAVRDASAPVLIKVLRDETRNRLAEEQRTLLLNELNHRINNTLVTVQSLADQTLRMAEVDSAVREKLAARFQALSQAHKVLTEHNWASAELSELVRRALEPFQSEARGRFNVEGPSVRLSPQQAVSFALILHELATNALKYGALSVSEGRVAVTWNQAVGEAAQRRMTLLWAESGGPPVAAPRRKGFGSRLLARSFPEGSSGNLNVEFVPEGVRCTVVVLLSEAEQPMLNLIAASEEPELNVPTER